MVRGLKATYWIYSGRLHREHCEDLQITRLCSESALADSHSFSTRNHMVSALAVSLKHTNQAEAEYIYTLNIRTPLPVWLEPSQPCCRRVDDADDALYNIM